jgi:hypothetical protein
MDNTVPMDVDMERPKFNLPQEQLIVLNKRAYLQRNLWKSLISDCEDDTWRSALAGVLSFLTDELAVTDLGASTIGVTSFRQAEALVETFNDKEIQEWKSGLQKGLKENDWADLISHHTHPLASGG